MEKSTSRPICSYFLTLKNYILYFKIFQKIITQHFLCKKNSEKFPRSNSVKTWVIIKYTSINTTNNEENH